MLTAWLSAIVGAVVTVPGLALLAHPLRRETVKGGNTPLRVAGLKELKPGKPLKCDVRGELIDAWSRVPDVKLGSCYVVRSENDGKVRAFSTVCPHLGCGIDWDDKDRRFVCPCHVSYFTIDGTAQTGPSPRDLDELEVTMQEKDVKVTYKRFRAGLTKKVEV